MKIISMMSYGKLLKRHLQHGEPNGAGKDEWHLKRCVIMGCSFYINSNTSGPQNCSKNSYRPNYGAGYSRAQWFLWEPPN